SEGGQPQRHMKLFRPGILVLSLSAAAALLCFAISNVSRSNFWYDESMQFWISLGVDGFGAPFTPPGTFKDVIRQNATANLDPGGFSILLAFWIKLSTGEAWQRLLPLIFFASGMAGLGRIGWTRLRSIPFTMLSAFVPAAFPLLLDYATEV